MPDVVFKELRGEGVLLDMASGIYFGLDEVSTRVWQLIARHGSLRVVFAEMLEEFEVDAQRLEEDLLAFASELVESHLATRAPTSD
ncbi:MAG: PqqD family protein [Acidobacteria bacterium]|nr:PqqD family protein [Acidobacteriota bacterium]